MNYAWVGLQNGVRRFNDDDDDDCDDDDDLVTVIEFRH